MLYGDIIMVIMMITMMMITMNMKIQIKLRARVIKIMILKSLVLAEFLFLNPFFPLLFFE